MSFSVSSFIWALVFCGILVLAGNVTLSAIQPFQRRPFFETFGLSVAIGAGALGLLLFWLSLADLKPTRAVVLAVGLVLASVLISQERRSRKFASWRSEWMAETQSVADFLKSGWIAATFAVVAIMTGVVVLHALAFPLYEWDASSIWGLKAKVLNAQSLRDQPAYFHDLSLSYSHLDYPLLVPFLVSGTYAVMGEMNDQLGKIIFPLLYVALGLILATALRRKLTAPRAIALTALFMSLPVLIRWAGAGTADLALTLFYAGSLIYLVKFLEEQNAGDLWVAALFSAFAVFTKSEGFPLAILNSIVLFFVCLRMKPKSCKRALLFSALWVGLSLPWLLWSHDLPRTHENYFGRFTVSILTENFGRVSVILPAFLRETLRWANWGIFWTLLIVTALLGRKAWREKPVGVLWILLLAHVALYFVSFVITPWNVEELLNSALDRLILHLTPAAALLISYHWASTPSIKAQPVKPDSV